MVCPNCGRSDYIRSFEKDFNIKNSEYRYKCINCNTYIKDAPQTDCYDYSKSEMENIKCGNGITTEIPQTDCEDIYPLVIIKDRYTGTYSNGEYTAWNKFFEDIPKEIDEDDVTCYDFWHSYNGIVGLGKTPNEAIEDLRKKLNAERNEDEK